MLHFNIGLNSLNILAFCGWRGHCNTACSDGGARKIWQNFYEFGLIKFLMIYMMSRYILCIYNWKLKKRNELHLLCIILLYHCFFQILIMLPDGQTTEEIGPMISTNTTSPSICITQCVHTPISPLITKHWPGHRNNHLEYRVCVIVYIKRRNIYF